jgi:ankyrin repeat protein
MEIAKNAQPDRQNHVHEFGDVGSTLANQDDDAMSSSINQSRVESLHLSSNCDANDPISSSTSAEDNWWSDSEAFEYRASAIDGSAPSTLTSVPRNSLLGYNGGIKSCQTPDVVSSRANEISSDPNIGSCLPQRTLPQSALPQSTRRGPQNRHSTVKTTVTADFSPQEQSSVLLQDYEDSMDVRRFITLTRESHRASIISIDSLRHRLDWKAESSLHDIVSVLQNHTISNSTKDSSRPSSSSSCKDNSNTTVIIKEKNQQSSENVEMSVALPFICQEKVLMEHDLHLPGSFASASLMLAKQERTSFSAQIRRSSSLYDVFGHTVLHVAAASGERPERLLGLIETGANVHDVNSGGETFLHLVTNISSSDYFHLGLLLKKLQVERFNFHQRDDHGQTPLHLITRQWVDDLAFEGIADNLLLYEIKLPPFRDNLGRTILGQMTDVGLRIPAIEHLEEGSSALRLPPILEVQASDNETGLEDVQFNDSQMYCLPNYRQQTYIKTVEDPQAYKLHANLLRTILKATTLPRHEDTNGRNGLHCLAEVSLSLPIPYPLPSNTTNERYAVLTRRQAYLSDLLAAGVDPDNCDKTGITPFMAFIIYTRDDEDDDTTVRILSRLLAAGANINRRDRKGQTSLHLAVKMGKTAVTRFLLDRGANIHARDSDGKSIIAVGKAHSDKASSDAKLYARIMMCISFMVDTGAVSAPTFLQEWARKY